MGCSYSFTIIPDNEDNGSSSGRMWQEIRTESELKDEFFTDGSLPVESCYSASTGTDNTRGRLELRTLLDYSVAREYILEYVKKSAPNSEQYFLGWFDMTAFLRLPMGSAKSTLAASIYRTHIIGNKSVKEIQRKLISEELESVSSIDNNQLFGEVQSRFFDEMFKLYLVFKTTPDYKKMVTALRRKYNRVKIGDFDFYEVLGEGGYGLVCSVRKRSTGKDYAMKIQRKDHLLSMFPEKERWRVNFEKQAFASLHHPFIVVMSLGSGQDLSRVLRYSGPLSQEQVLFYSAEVTSALSYLHNKYYVYRDLKPGNILLNLDGHIQLVDFGAVCDLKGKTMAVCNNAADLLPVFAQQKQVEDSALPLSQFWSTIAAEENGAHQSVSITTRGARPRLGTLDHPELAPEITPDPDPSQRDVPPPPLSTTVAGTAAAADAGAAAGAAASNVPTCATTPMPTDSQGAPAKSPNSRQQRDEASQGLSRAKSFIGTYGYMAPEMVQMLGGGTYGDSAGYTKAVDWWSLGVTMYKLLVGSYPFKIDFRGLPEGANSAARRDSSARRYMALLEDVNYHALRLYPAVVSLISQLLVVKEKKRLGYGATGSQDVSAHPYFQSIDWVKLEQKQLPPPALPEGLPEGLFRDGPSAISNRTEPAMSLPELLFQDKKMHWLKVRSSGASGTTTPVGAESSQPAESGGGMLTDDFIGWDYTSPVAVMLELGHTR